MGILYNKIFHNNTTEGTTLFAKLVYLCDEFENIGSSFWEIKECLSIRCRYFFYYKARVYRCQFHQCSTSNFFTHPDPDSVKKSVSLLCFQFQQNVDEIDPRPESYPGLVYNYDAAVRALNLAEEIFTIVASVSEETLTSRASPSNGIYK